MKLTPGKLAGMKAVSDSRGVIAAAAMDQRGSLKKALGPNAGDKELIEFKTSVTEILTPHASAILLDPEWGLPASKARARTPACCWLTRRRVMTRPAQAASETCSITGASVA